MFGYWNWRCILQLCVPGWQSHSWRWSVFSRFRMVKECRKVFILQKEGSCSVLQPDVTEGFLQPFCPSLGCIQLRFQFCVTPVLIELFNKQLRIYVLASFAKVKGSLFRYPQWKIHGKLLFSLFNFNSNFQCYLTFSFRVLKIREEKILLYQKLCSDWFDI